MRLGVIGLGNMGLPLLQSWAAKGFDVVGYDIDSGRRALAPASITAISDIGDQDVVALSLPSSREVEPAVVALLEVLSPGALIIDTSTASPSSTRELHRLAKASGIRFVDAPVSGGASGAAAGTLLVMAGGEPADLDAAAPILQAVARKVVRCGGPGAGNVVKLINNLLCAGNLLLVGEALRLAAAGDVAIPDLLEALNAGSGGSAVTQINVPRWIASGSFDSGFTMALMAKDVGLAAGLAGASGLTADTARRWQVALKEIGGAADFNRIVELKP